MNVPKRIHYVAFQVNNHLIYDNEEETLSNFPRGLILIKQHFAPILIVQLPRLHTGTLNIRYAFEWLTEQINEKIFEIIR